LRNKMDESLICFNIWQVPGASIQQQFSILSNKQLQHKIPGFFSIYPS
jgi:hypothetical protein